MAVRTCHLSGEHVLRLVILHFWLRWVGKWVESPIFQNCWNPDQGLPRVEEKEDPGPDFKTNSPRGGGCPGLERPAEGGVERALLRSHVGAEPGQRAGVCAGPRGGNRGTHRPTGRVPRSREPGLTVSLWLDKGTVAYVP